MTSVIEMFQDPRFAHVHMVATEWGHAYGTAKYNGRCPLTGLEIWIGEPIRKVTIATRAGKVISGYTANRILAHLQFVGAGLGYSEWVLGADGLPEVAGDTTAKTVHVLQRGRGISTWHWDSCLESWCSPGGRSTRAQFGATLRRGKNNVAYRVAR